MLVTCIIRCHRPFQSHQRIISLHDNHVFSFYFIIEYTDDTAMALILPERAPIWFFYRTSSELNVGLATL